MNYRTLGKTGFKISDVSLGTWQVGGTWGSSFNEKNAQEILAAAMDNGVNFLDTADVYGDGESEKMVGRAIKSRRDKIYVATKCGRKISPHVSSGYTPAVLRKYIEDSLSNMKADCLDLIQLHCPPTEVYSRPEIFGLFDKLKDEGKIRFLGVSVEKVDEAMAAIEYPNVCSIQIIFNMFRHKPAEVFFAAAAKKSVGIIARVPLASGLLAGSITPQTHFEKGDHRFFNREGAAFDKGETFSGVDLETGYRAVTEIKKLFPGSAAGDASLAAWATRWILMFPEVSTVIPGASKPSQALANCKASELAAISPDVMAGISRIYNELIKPKVHHLW